MRSFIVEKEGNLKEEKKFRKLGNRDDILQIFLKVQGNIQTVFNQHHILTSSQKEDIE